MVYSVAWVEAYLRTKWHLDLSSRLTTTDMGRKLRGLCPLFWWGGGPNLTQCGLEPPYKWHFDPSNRLATYTNITDRQRGQDGQDRKWSDSMGRTVYKRSPKNGRYYYILSVC